MTDSMPAAEQSARAVVRGVIRKTGVLSGAGALAGAGLQSVLWPGLPFWAVPLGVLFGAVLGAANFHWLASAVERVYLRKGTTGALSTLAAVVVNVLKLSAIFVVLFVVIKKDLLNIFSVVAGLSFCFLAILWQGMTVMTAGPEDGKRQGDLH